MQRALGLAQSRAQGVATSANQDLVAPAGWAPKGEGAATATTEEPGVFTDDELRQGTVVAPEGGGGFYIEAPDGTRKRADAAALMRILALRGSNVTKKPEAAAAPFQFEFQSRAGEGDQMLRLGEQPIGEAPNIISNGPRFGAIVPSRWGQFGATPPAGR
jgi:hypothetical protein